MNGNLKQFVMRIVVMTFVLAACAPTAAPPTPDAAATAEAMAMKEEEGATATAEAEAMAMAESESATATAEAEAMAMEEITSDTGAAGLRTALDLLLSEHVVLAASATGAALGGRTPEFEAAAAALDANSVDVAAAIGSVYGAGAEDAFLPLWRTHIGFVVDYTTGLAAADVAKQDQAVADLLAYTQDFGAFLSSANPNLPQEVVAGLVEAHILTLKSVIDAQAAGDPAAAYTALREAFSHMDMIGGALAGGIVAQFPEQFDGAADSPASNLRVGLNLLLAEHAYLAASATGAALGGRTPEFEAAAAALDANSVDVAAAIGSVYGAGAEDAFLPLWRTHIGFVVDYTTGLAAADVAKQDAAVANLLAYTQDFGAFLSSANPNLPQEVVAGLVEAHILTLKSVIDAQAAGDPAAAYTALREAYGHMSMIADPLAEAIVMQFPDSFK